MKKVMFTMALALFKVGLMAQPGSEVKSAIVFNDAKVELAYTHYLRLKDALVASRADAAKEAAVKLKNSLASAKGSNTDNYQDAIRDAIKIADASTMDDRRETFASLSHAMTLIVKDRQLSKGIIYLEYCPMANNNKGAYWLSNEKEIKNPYFGEKMLSCGSVKETIH